MTDEKTIKSLEDENVFLREKREVLQNNIDNEIYRIKNRIKILVIYTALISLALVISLKFITELSCLKITAILFTLILCIIFLFIIKEFKRIRILKRELSWFFDYSNKIICLNKFEIENK